MHPRLAGVLGASMVSATLAMSACGHGAGAHGAEPPRPVASSTPAATPGAPTLRLLWAKARRGAIGNFWFVDGEVQNVCATAFDRIAARVQVFDAAGALVASDSDLLSRALLAPGAVARFSVVTQDRPDLTAFEIQFRTADGASLQTADTGRRSFQRSSSDGGRAADGSREQ